MADWDMSAVRADFFEVVPENWVHRNRDPLHRLIQSGRPVQLHGVSLNLGGTSVNLKQRNSLVPNLRSSKTEGQANFVNPGVFIYVVEVEYFDGSSEIISGDVTVFR